MSSAETFVILNGAGYRWGKETYPSIDAARKEVRSFFKGWSGVKFDHFSIVQISQAPEITKQYIIPYSETA